MTEQQPPVGDDDLNAYVDGRLDGARRELVAHYLAANPEQQKRVRDWASQSDQLRRALRQDAADETAVTLARLVRSQVKPAVAPWWRGMPAIAASVVLALVLGGVGGWIMRGDRNPTEIARLGQEAASAYRIFANDPSRSIEISSDNQAELVNWMSQKLGRGVTLPDLAGMGYHLMGGRVLSAMYGPAAMLIYRDANDDRIIVYLQPMRIGAPAAMQPLAAKTVDGYAWIDHKVGYTVMSEGDHTRLRSVANQVHEDTGS
jgi:anti-sigma factor RsiW